MNILPQPTMRNVHINQPLTQISIAYIQQANQFVATRIFPTIPVQKQSDRYFKYLRDNWFRSEAKERAPATESAGGGWTIDNTPTYYAKVYAVHKDVDDQIRANADNPIDMDRDATEWTTHQLLLNREKIWVANYFQTGIWTGDLDGTGADFEQWDIATSTPIEDVTEESINMARRTGFKPNVLVLSPSVFNALKNHPDIIDRVKYTQMGIVTADLLASLFEVDRVVVPWAVENTAVEGQALDMDFIFGDHALLLYANPSPGILQPSAGYHFSWTGFLGAGQQGNRIRSFRMEHLSADRIEGEQAFDAKLVAPDLGTFFANAIS